MEKTLSLYIMDDTIGRLDTYIAEKAHISRTQVQKLILEGMVTHNYNQNPKPGVKLKKGDLIFVRIPIPKITNLKKENIPIDIIYEDEHIVVVNKERGMVVHPAAGHQDGTLINALLFHVEEMEEIGDEQRPGIVHRLDKNTSGLLIAAKTAVAHQKLVEMFHLHKIMKEYVAVVHGRMKGREGIVNLPVGRDPKDRKKFAVVAGGKKSITRWKVKKAYKNFSLISVFPETGRTHQIRVHLKYLGNPVVGDPEYAENLRPPTDIRGQALHCLQLQLDHPVTGEKLSFIAPLPLDMEILIEEIENFNL